MNNSEISFICISNASGEEYPDNTLTKFKNRLPTKFEWRKNGVYRYQIAIDAVGISTNFTTTRLPEKKENPSLILANPLKWPQELQTQDVLKDKEIPIQNTCLGLESLPEHCNTTILDPELNLIMNRIPNSFGFDYFYIEDETMTVKKYVKLFQNIVDQSNGNLTFKYNENDETIEIKSIGSFQISESLPDSMWSATHLFFHKSLLSNIELILNSSEQPTDESFTQYRTYLNLFNHDYTINGEEYYRIFLHYGFQSVKINLSNVLRKKYPNIIKIKCDQIKSQIFDSHLSKDLICFHPEIPESDPFFFHEVEHKQFFPLENTILDNLEFTLVDENNNQLNLLEGIATVLKLRLKKMSYFKKSFNVRLTSRPTPLHPDNKNSSFTVTLPQTLYLDESWRVAVTNVNLPNVFATVPARNFVKFTYRGKNEVIKRYEHVFKNQKFTKEELLNTLNSNFDRMSGGEKLISFHEDMVPNSYEKTVFIRVHKKDAAVQISKDLIQLLGYGAEDFLSMEGLTYKVFMIKKFPEGQNYYDIRMSLPVNLNYFQPSYTILYSNIVSPTIVGNSYSNIIKVFPIFSKSDDYVIHQFKDPEHYSLLNKEINSISLVFKNHAGDTLNFASKNIVIVDLVFSNYI